MPLLGNPLNKKSAPRPAPGMPAGKPRVTVGSLFNPNLGATLRPFGQTGKMLVELIAAIFAIHGLFPRNHPALLGINGARLTLSEVIRTGWSNVRFTRESLPQALIFFAVVISLVCSGIAICVILMSLFTGTAHAQIPTGASMFQAPNTATDIALGWINWLFFGQQMQTDYLGPLNQQMPSGMECGVQSALTTTLGFYSDAILVVAAIILFYHLTSMIVETAHHGVAMGRRANQVWAPIRLVVAIGLLVPVGLGTSGGGACGSSSGLNSGQYIILQIAAWGSGLASNAWSIFANALVSDNFKFVPPAAPYARAAVVNSYLTAACQQAYNQIVQHTPVQNTPQIPNAGVPSPNNDGVNGLSGSVNYDYSPQVGVVNGAGGVSAGETLDKQLCGYYIQPAQPTATGADSSIVNGAYTGVWGAFQTMQTAAIYAGEADVEMFIDPTYGGQWPGAQPTIPNSNQAPSGVSIEDQVANYVSNLQSAMNGLTNSGSMTTVEATSIQQGWASAGSWFNTIMRLQGEMQDIPRDLQPKTGPPQVEEVVNENRERFGKDTPEYQTYLVMNRFQRWLSLGFNSGVTGVNPSVVTTSGAPNQQQLLAAEAAGGENSSANKGHFMDDIFRVIDWVASWNGVWQAPANGCNSVTCFTLGVQFTSYNPLAEIAQFGHANIDTAYDLFDDYIVLMMGSSVGNLLGGLTGNLTGLGPLSFLLRMFGNGAHMTGEAAAAIGTVLGTVVLVFFTSGFLLAYFLPLIPFYRFLFGILSWFFSLFEAVVAVPLIALAHLTPEGEGFMGDKAKTAYYYAFDIFLRPTLMVFGLVTGFLIFDLAASAMNLLYVSAVAGAGGLSSGHLALSRLVYSILYVVILYLCCNNCFKLIDWLPEHAIKWMGGQSLHHQQMGDPMDVGGYMGIASGYVDNQIIQGTGKLANGPGGALALGAMANNKIPHGKEILAHVGADIGRIGGPQAQSIYNSAIHDAGSVEGAVAKLPSAARKQFDKGMEDYMANHPGASNLAAITAGAANVTKGAAGSTYDGLQNAVQWLGKSASQ